MKSGILAIFLLLVSVYHRAENGEKQKPVRKTLHAKVTSAQGEEIGGARITIKETNETYFSNFDGSFTISVNSGQIYHLKVESIGFQTLEVKSTDIPLFSELNLKEL